MFACKWSIPIILRYATRAARWSATHPWRAIGAWFLYGRRVDWLALRRRFAGAWRPLAEKLYVDQVYEFFTVNLGRALAAFLARTVDQRVIDGAVNGLAELVGNGARSGRRLQSGLVRSYALGVLGGAVLIVAFLVFRP